MQTVYKYPLAPMDPLKANASVTLEIPELKGYGVKEQILRIGTQNDFPYVWCLIDPNAKMRKVKFMIMGTGAPADNLKPENYIGTYTLFDDALVFHVFILEEAQQL